MRLLTDELPELPDYERRDLINKLRDAGAPSASKSARVSRTRFPSSWSTTRTPTCGS